MTFHSKTLSRYAYKAFKTYTSHVVCQKREKTNIPRACFYHITWTKLDFDKNWLVCVFVRDSNMSWFDKHRPWVYVRDYESLRLWLRCIEDISCRLGTWSNFVFGYKQKHFCGCSWSTIYPEVQGKFKSIWEIDITFLDGYIKWLPNTSYQSGRWK